VLPVTIGTTAGMMIANVPAVLFGEAITRVVPLRAVRFGAAAVLATLGAGVLLLAT
jgi:putative Ca2+/H+ antiporter (TMEM165/GDT1 family)